MNMNGVHLLPFNLLRILEWNEKGLDVGFRTSIRPTWLTLAEIPDKDIRLNSPIKYKVTLKEAYLKNKI